MAKMGGPFIPLPQEVIDLLETETPVCMTAYILMLRKFFTEEDTNTEGIWVGAWLHTTRYDVGMKVSGSRGYFDKSIWPRWETIGIVEIRDGGIYLPMYYKKGDAFLQPLRMRGEIDHLKAEQAKMQKIIQDLLTVISETREVKAISTSSERTRSVLSEDVSVLSEDVPLSLLCIDLKKISLSEINKLISRFYKGLVRPRISKTVREKAIKSFQDLMRDGFTPGQIAYAIDWIPKNAKEPVKHFGIVPHMIDQAIEAGEKELEAEEERQAQESERLETQKNMLSEQEEREALRRFKEGLDQDKREELRSDALLKLRGTPGINPDMIIAATVEWQENELLRKAGVDLKAALEEGGGAED